MSRFDDDMNGFEPSAAPAPRRGQSWRASSSRSSNPRDGFGSQGGAHGNVVDFETARRIRQQETLDSGVGAYDHAVPSFPPRKPGAPKRDLGYNPSEVRVSSSSLVRGSRLEIPEIPSARASRDFSSYEPSAFDRSGSHARKSAPKPSGESYGPSYSYDSRSVGITYNSAFRDGYAPVAGARPAGGQPAGMGSSRGSGMPGAGSSRGSGMPGAGSPRVFNASSPRVPSASGRASRSAVPMETTRMAPVGGRGAIGSRIGRRSSSGASSVSGAPIRSSRIGDTYNEPAASRVRDRRSEVEEDDEDYAPRRGRMDGLKDKMAKRKRDQRHKRADRDFESHVPKDRNKDASQESGPRAALHKGEMGRSQKKAQRMQLPSVSLPGIPLPSFGGINFKGLAANARFKTVAIVLGCVLLAGAFVYPTAQDYYITLRSNAQMEAELQAIQERNALIQQRIDTLSSDEGVEDKVREELGWVKQGENSVSVGREGSSDIAANGDETTASIAAGSVRAPDTWYSGFLDFFFGYDNSPVEVATDTGDTTLTDDEAAADGSDDEQSANGDAASAQQDDASNEGDSQN